MSDLAIRVQDLSKLYCIGRAQPTFPTLCDALMDGARAALTRLRHGRPVAKKRRDTIGNISPANFGANIRRKE